jgi:hypothetical protein
LSQEPIYQWELRQESPAIHVTLAAGVDPIAYQWVEIGAEEEGVPCRKVAGPADDLRTAASAAAQASRISVGVAVGPQRVLVHEAHMPVNRPIWELDYQRDLREACRLAGCNAGRVVKRMPLRFTYVATPVSEARPVAASKPGDGAPALSRERLVKAIALSLEQRGLL